ncbi:LOW QUALITY PROTEIN: hypothetical protein OSB04_002460 [Centaurea solstitialis]|uniref:DUF4218 domain-containing protein n=1 Tax=Centaurea solstitialis TaxID=347529 RepID=A0AA38WUV6_9ASTR|nr:LOW QUALITY PROTEIN: hypothetical protein OSB04_002460 [Centaurea solstitialis]
MQSCQLCHESRWKDKYTKGLKVANKVLCYFPLTSRLKRLYSCIHTAESMTWHATGKCTEDGRMRHPVDGTYGKILIKDFARETRNVRLGLAADGFNPYGNMSLSYSMWPVILTTYNMPPWLCMKESSLILTLLILGPKSPGKDIDVYLRSLVDELKSLWSYGVQTRDVATNSVFQMRVMLLWTINDFPARHYLSGWSGQGYLACPTCNADTPSTRMLGKTAYVGHRRFLPHNHKWRKDKKFNGNVETRSCPRKFDEADILEQLNNLPLRTSGKHPSYGGSKASKRKREPNELNWSKRSIFFELGYWSSLQLKHNLDVMHIEKNVCESSLGTLLMNDKSKDTTNARKDLEKLMIRDDLWLKEENGKLLKPHPKFFFTREHRRLFCKFIKGVKLPDGFGSNFKRKVFDTEENISGMKSHGYHIMMQRLMPLGFRGYLDPTISTPIIELSSFFKQICARNLMTRDMENAKEQLIKILCTFC